MKMLDRASRYVRPLIFAATVCAIALVAHAQTTSQIPAPTAQINDFAGVVDTQAKARLESILLNLKDKTKIEFFVVMVDTTGGQDIFDFSRQVALDWNIRSPNSKTKSLLLVISVASKTSMTQFSRLMTASLPDGILGDMTQRMRTPLSEGRFTEAVEQGVRLFIDALGQKLGFSAQDLEKNVTTAVAAVGTESNQHPVTEPPKTRPRVVNEIAKPQEREKEVTTPTQAEEKQLQTVNPIPETSNEVKQPEKIVPTRTPKASAKSSKPTPTSKKVEEPVDDEAESEEVELTLTLPLAKRAEKLKSFLETHPDSKARPRATELLISTHAGLGDQFLKAGDPENGVKQLMLAIDESEVGISDKLFSGVLSQIPSNLYLRGQGEAAFQAANKIETKFSADPKRLLIVAGFYLGIERGDEAQRIAEQALKLAPDLAEAHRVLAVSHHINLQLDAAAAEYKRSVELDPTSRASQSSLADLSRATGKFEEALVQYNELLKADPKDRTAMAGMVLCLFELGRKEEAMTAMDAALATEPKNLALLSGAAYWFAAHGDYEKSFDFARKAVSVEPRYTWAQIALVRSLIGLKRPVAAERAMRYARQYGKFPTLNYELANVVAVMGFYDEAAEILRESFTYKDGQIETLLAGRIAAHDSNFLDLLSPERRASIYQPNSADSAANSKILSNLLELDHTLSQSEGEKLDETSIAKTARDFSSGNDNMRAYRQLYAASRLLKKSVALNTALELVNEAKQGLELALDVPVATTAAQADEFRNLRAQAISSGSVPDVAEAPRSALSNIMSGRIEDLTGWILFNQDKYPEAIEHLTQASAILPNGTPAWRTTLWHLGVVYEQTGRNDEALESYIKSYNSGERDPIRRSVIEKIYRKVKGSVEGLEDRIGPSFVASTNSDSGVPRPPATPETSAATTPEATTEKSTKPVETTTTEPAKPEPTPAPSPEASATPEATPTPTPTASEPPAPTQPEPISDEALRAAGSRLRSNIKITGRVLDANRNGLSNVVVVLISPSGSVLASTTDNEGYYSFTVTPSQKTYRLIPSKDGYSFSPMDKIFVGLIDDQKGIDFTGSVGRSP